MTSQNGYAASQARNAVDKTTDLWTQGTRGVTGLVPRLPQIDLIPAVQRYFDVVQLTVDINRYLTVKWVQAAGRLTGVVREQAEKAEQERAREARKAERQQARQARERYEGQTKAELSDQLAARDLPKTGNVDELIERLVEADTK
jgi:hypothetical protein